MSDTPIQWRRGADAAAAADAASGGGGGFNKVRYFKVGDGERAVVRFLTDGYDWIVVDQYSYVPTKPRPTGYTGNWPDRMGAVSRSDKNLKHLFGDDFIGMFLKKPDGKPFKATPRDWAYAVMRQEVLGDGTPELGGPDMKGKLLGHRDATREVQRKIEGSDELQTVVEKDIVIVNMAYSNFFSPLEGMFRAYGTVLDRDYYVMRKGSGKDTDYQFAPLQQVLLPGVDGAPGVPYDVRVPEIAARYNMVVKDSTYDSPTGPTPYKSVQPGEGFPQPSLEDVILDLCSDEYYGRFFDSRVEVAPPGQQANTNGDGAAPVATPQTDATDDRVAAMAARVKGMPTGDAAPAAPAPEAPVPSVASPSSPMNFG